MKKEKSVASVVLTHIVTTSIVIPFFGLFVGYFISKFLGASLEPTLLIILKDIVFILIFFLGVKYSLSQIDKRIDVKHPLKCSKYSIIVFGLLVLLVLGINVWSNFSIIAMVYAVIYYGIIFGVFLMLTRKYFKNLKAVEA
ncbi:MAG: hypothetical protein GQ531_08980 [Sulfurovum sp.]|nr:hypothetical protein [Sulfurovum sp.]